MSAAQPVACFEVAWRTPLGFAQNICHPPRVRSLRSRPWALLVNSFGVRLHGATDADGDMLGRNRKSPMLFISPPLSRLPRSTGGDGTGNRARESHRLQTALAASALEDLNRLVGGDVVEPGHFA